MKAIVALSSVTVIAAVALPCRPAHATQLHELPSILVISKSSNRNQVRYAALVDDACAPAGKSPVRPYWLMLEHGPNATEELQPREQRVLGVERQQVTGDSVEFALAGMPGRTFVAHTGRAADGQCTSWVGTTIAGVPARVIGVFAQQGLFGVDYVLLTGRSDEGRTVSERVSP